MEFVVEGKVFYDYKSAEAYENRLKVAKYVNNSKVTHIIDMQGNHQATVIVYAKDEKERKALSAVAIANTFGSSVIIDEEDLDVLQVYSLDNNPRDCYSAENITKSYYPSRQFGITESVIGTDDITIVVVDKVTEKKSKKKDGVACMVVGCTRF